MEKESFFFFISFRLRLEHKKNVMWYSQQQTVSVAAAVADWVDDDDEVSFLFLLASVRNQLALRDTSEYSPEQRFTQQWTIEIDIFRHNPFCELSEFISHKNHLISFHIHTIWGEDQREPIRARKLASIGEPSPMSKLQPSLHTLQSTENLSTSKLSNLKWCCCSIDFLLWLLAMARCREFPTCLSLLCMLLRSIEGNGSLWMQVEWSWLEL